MSSFNLAFIKHVIYKSFLTLFKRNLLILLLCLIFCVYLFIYAPRFMKQVDNDPDPISEERISSSISFSHKLFNNQVSIPLSHHIKPEDLYIKSYFGINYTFIRINEDPLGKYIYSNSAIQNASITPDRRLFRAKTKICSDSSKRLSFCGPAAPILYTAPVTHSTRLVDNVFQVPADALYIAPHGIAAYCDWIIMSKLDGTPLGVFGTTLAPKVIYLQSKLIHFFANYVVKILSQPFLLVTACNDFTVPINVDLRYSEIDNVYQSEEIWTSPMLMHWYAENKFGAYSKMSTLPIGASLAMTSPDHNLYPYTTEQIQKRHKLIMVSYKIHNEEPQWDHRRQLAKLCAQNKDICTAYTPSQGATISHSAWLQAVSEHQFLACGHGGGLDPSPKAWETIRVGTIPIIEKNSLYDAYSLLPIAWVDNLLQFMAQPSEIIRKKCNEWLETLTPYYIDKSLLRNDTLDKLTSEFWYNRILARHNLSRT